MTLNKILSQLLIIAVLLGLATSAVLLISYQRFQKTPISLSHAGQVVTVPWGSSLRRLANDLEQQGIIRYSLFLVLLGRELDADRRLHAGEFVLHEGMTPRDLLQLMTDGKVIQHGLTLIEGQTFSEMLVRIQEHPVIEVTLTDMSDAAIMERLGYPGEHPEGRFLADTYYFPRQTTDVEFLQRAYRAMEQQLLVAWEARADGLPYENPYAALIMASIVEKETGRAEERPVIAGVFVRRLQKGMRLQTDPTVIYGIGKQFDGNLRRRDLKNDTPYNTYTRAGLPPTPIAMPGVAAIQAALSPASGNSLYFVSRGDGSHYFSSTLKVHERAVDKFQRGKKGVKLP